MGVIAYEMLTGHYPYKEQTVKKFALRSYHHMDYVSVRKHRSDLPAWWMRY